MSKSFILKSTLALSIALILQPSAYASGSTPTNQELWELIQKQQSTIEQLKKQLDQTENDVADTQEAIEDVQMDQSDNGLASTKIGGYGELHYNNLDGKQDKIDLHRFVLFFEHEFNEQLRFFSELEVEHAFSSSSAPGEVEIEQAYLEYDFSRNFHLLGGVYMVPVGFINETHEPPTFYGVERNNVEKNIIPTTWWEAGIGINGEVGEGFKYDLMLSSGLNTPTTGKNAFLIRKGRQKTAEAVGESGALTARVRFTGIKGLELGLTGQYQDDITQDSLGIRAKLLETHASYQYHGFGLKALYAKWWLSGKEPKAFGRDRQDGFYIEPSYKFSLGQNQALGFFARHEAWNNTAGNNNDDKQQQTIGFNYWPDPDVVIKADYQWQNNEAGNADGFNLGIGYQF